MQKAVQTVINKAWDDEQFRRAFIANPKASIKKSTGLEIPANVKLVVNDQTNPNKLYINIPPKQNVDDMELTDEQLEQVAGGGILGGIASLFSGGYKLIKAGVEKGW